MSESEWTCEGKPKSVCMDYIQMVGATVIRPLYRSMYDGTWLSAFFKRMNIGGTAGELNLSYKFYRAGFFCGAEILLLRNMMS